MTTINDHQSTKQPLSLHETVSRASRYAFGVAALWGATYFVFILWDVPKP